MKVYIRIKHTGEFFNQNCFDVYTGCLSLGIPVVPYKAVYSIEDNEPEDPIVGTLDDVEVAMDKWEFICFLWIIRRNYGLSWDGKSGSPLCSALPAMLTAGTSL